MGKANKKLKDQTFVVAGGKEVKLTKKERKRLKELQDLNSEFGKALPNIREAFETTTEQGVTSLQDALLYTVMDLIPSAEAKYRKSMASTDAYVVNSLVSQVRELTADKQSTLDKMELASQLIERIMVPSYRNQAQMLVTQFELMKTNLQPYIGAGKSKSATREINSALRTIGEFLDSSAQSTYAKLEEELDG